MIQEQTLEQFKKDKRNYFVDWTKKQVEWNNQFFDIKFHKINGKMYPYVVLSKQIGLSELNDEIQKVNEFKSYLKGTIYEINGDEYLITGIGFQKIKARKNDGKDDWYFYGSNPGHKLLELMLEDVKIIEIILSQEAYESSEEQFIF